MATINLRNYTPRQFGSAPYGNLSTLRYGFATNSTGAVINSSQSTAAASGDVIDLGELPAGFVLEDATVLVKTALTASVTCKLGFKYTDGVDVTAVPQDDDYFGATIALATVGKVRATNASIVTLPKPARLILTIGGADNAKAGEVAVVVHGELLGNK